MTTETPFAIKVAHLTVSYNARPALLDVSVKIEKDRLVGVIGPNGTGKSTFIKEVLGFVKPDLGTVKIHGTEAKNAKGQVAYVPQRGAVDWDFPITVREVALMGRYQQIPWYTSPRKTDRDKAMDMVRMADFAHRQIGELSGGQQQRVFMARALAQGSDILLLDEPFAGVDAATERAILHVLERAKTSGKPWLSSTTTCPRRQSTLINCCSLNSASTHTESRVSFFRRICSARSTRAG